MSEEMEKKNEIAAVDDVEENFLVISLEEPYKFEGKSYDKIDLMGLRNIRAVDMVNVSRAMNRSGNFDFLQENSMEYTLRIAAEATNQPLEFFYMMPPYLAMEIKGRVTAFLHGRA